jgi:hypothetical protein
MDGSYQVLVHLAIQFQGRRFSEIDQPETKLWQPCLLTDRNEMSYLNRGISIDASYQVLVHLAK